jgi:ATP-binding cassette subfamily B protein
MGGNLHEYSEEEQDLGKIYDRVLMRRLVSYMKPYRLEISLLAVLIIGNMLALLAGPYLLRIAINRYIQPRELEGLELIAFLMIAAMVAELVFSYVAQYRMQMLGQKIMFDLRTEIFSHLQRQDVSYFDRNPVGRLMTRVMGDVQVLNELFTSGVITIFANLFNIIGIMVMMLIMNWKLALVTFTVLPIIFAATTFYQVYSRRAFRDQRKHLARINAFLNEKILGMTTVQLFTQERRSFLKFDERNQEYLRASLKTVIYFSMFFPLIEVVGSLATAIIVWYGGGQILQNALTFGDLVAFIQYAQRLFWPIRDLSEQYTIFQSAMASSERIFELLDTQPTIVDAAAPRNVNQFQGQLELRNVRFAYQGDNHVLQDVSFKVKPGEKVAIVGHTGSGKTTIINLLCRFYEANEGVILIDGVDIREMRLRDLRRAISIVQQNIFLFSDSIEENIRLGNRGITREQVVAAATEVHLDKFVRRMADGYDTRVQEGGSGLSVGQKQLVAFARALVSNPDILILDEATSSVDTETELLIQDALSRLMKNRTSIVIAHRLSTIQNADKIIVMHKGGVREMGTHNELLQKRGIYYRLYQLQYKGQEVG